MKKIYVNPGHSDRDPGAVGYEIERQLNVQAAAYMERYLKEHYDCQVRSNPGSMDSLSAICADANGWGADLFVSVHFNAARGDGFEALVYSQARVPMGRIFEKHVQAVGQNSRGVKLRTDLSVLKYTVMPAVLCEGAFVYNWADIRDWNDPAELKVLGEAYARAAAEVLDLQEKGAAAADNGLEPFIRQIQKAIGAVVDGVAGPQTLGLTPTLSAGRNRTHAAVRPVQERLAELGYSVVGPADGMTGPKFEAAVVAFQEDNRCWVDGEITAGNKTWRKLLGME